MIVKIGHRGAMGYEPENTLISFRKALEFKVDMIEFDIHVCKTGEIIVIHDETVNRTTNGTGYVKDKTLEELKLLDAGKGERIPTLNEVLDLLNKKTKVNIELKGENTEERLAELIKRYINEKGWNSKDFIISSFDFDKLIKIKYLIPEIRIGVLFNEKPDTALKFAEEIKAYSLNIAKDLINKNFIVTAHDKGFKVLAWTANDYKDIQKMKFLGVDGIFSNYPDRF